MTTASATQQSAALLRVPDAMTTVSPFQLQQQQPQMRRTSHNSQQQQMSRLKYEDFLPRDEALTKRPDTFQ